MVFAGSGFEYPFHGGKAAFIIRAVAAFGEAGARARLSTFLSIYTVADHRNSNFRVLPSRDKAKHQGTRYPLCKMSSNSNSNIPSPETAYRLAINNLLHVFSQRDASKRLETVKATYTPDVQFHEPEGSVLVGHEALSIRAGALLDERAGWRFVPKGNVKQTGEMIYLAWEFGPAVEGKELGEDGSVEVMVTGADVILTDGGLISSFWVVIDGLCDVKV